MSARCHDIPEPCVHMSMTLVSGAGEWANTILMDRRSSVPPHLLRPVYTLRFVCSKNVACDTPVYTIRYVTQPDAIGHRRHNTVKLWCLCYAVLLTLWGRLQSTGFSSGRSLNMGEIGNDRPVDQQWWLPAACTGAEIVRSTVYWNILLRINEFSFLELLALLFRVYCLNHVMVFLCSDWTVPTTYRMELDVFYFQPTLSLSHAIPRHGVYTI